MHKLAVLLCVLLCNKLLLDPRLELKHALYSAQTKHIMSLLYQILQMHPWWCVILGQTWEASFRVIGKF